MPFEENLLVPDDVRRLVLRTVSYIDSVEMQSKRYPSGEFIRFAQANCGKTYGPYPKKTYDNRFVYSFSLHQPSRKLVEKLRTNPATIVRTTVSLDLITGSREAAHEIHGYLDKHLLQSTKPVRPLSWYTGKEGRTTYFGHPVTNRPGLSLAIYSDLPSKVPPHASCCHLDWRVSGAVQLRDAKLRRPDDLLRLGEDHQRFWRERLLLVNPPALEVIGDAWLKHHLSNKRTAPLRFPWRDREIGPHRVAGWIVRGARSHDEDGHLYCSDLAYKMDRMPKVLGAISSSRLFPRLGTDWLLPSDFWWNTGTRCETAHKKKRDVTST